MSRKVETDFEFDKNKFANLLNQARGNQMVKNFADECGVSFAYMSRYLHEKMDSPPTPSTIGKMAQRTSKNGVSESELLFAAGYEVGNYIENVPSVFVDTYMRAKSCMATVKNSIFSKQFRWEVLDDKFPSDCLLSNEDNPSENSSWKDDDNESFDLRIKIEGDEIEEWRFKYFFHIQIPPSPFPNYSNAVASFYYWLITSPYSERTKISLVIDDPDIYDEFLKKQPEMLPIYLSIVLVDPQKLHIIKEDYLKTRTQISEDMKTKYVLTKPII